MDYKKYNLTFNIAIFCIFWTLPILHFLHIFYDIVIAYHWRGMAFYFVPLLILTVISDSFPVLNSSKIFPDRLKEVSRINRFNWLWCLLPTTIWQVFSDTFLYCSRRGTVCNGPLFEEGLESWSSYLVGLIFLVACLFIWEKVCDLVDKKAFDKYRKDSGKDEQIASPKPITREYKKDE